MSNLTFSNIAWQEYLYWQTQDRKTLNKINKLLKNIQRTPFDGIGKPEPLKHKNNYWSRRIDSTNRLVYFINENNDIVIISCRGHYKN